MAKLQLEGFAAERLAENLMAKANAKHGHTAFDQILRCLHSIAERGWIAGTIGKENSGRFGFQSFGRWRGGRHDLHSKSVLPQPPENVVLHPKIVGHDR